MSAPTTLRIGLLCPTLALLILAPGCAGDGTPLPVDARTSDGTPDAPAHDLSAHDLSARDLGAHDAAAHDAAAHDQGLAPDSAAQQDLGGCAPVKPAPDKDPWTQRLPSAGFGGIVTQSAGGHTDVFLKSPTDYTRVGVRLDWGGTVVFFGLSANAGSNVIDANDTGRELQIALYDPTRAHQPCAATATCVSNPQSCGNSITYLGWNPVQGGDECGHGAPVLSHGQVGDALRVTVQPIQWNPDWDKPDCSKSACPAKGVPVAVTYVMELRFLTKHVVEVMNQVTSAETISHPVTGQEWPTLYVAHNKSGLDLPLLIDAAGKTVSLTTPGNDGFYYGNFSSSAPWVSWQDAGQTYGVGLAMDQGITAFQGWRGDGVTAPYFHNVRAQIAFGLAAGATVRGLSYLALGNTATVKAELGAVLAKRPPFGKLDSPAKATVSYTPGSPVSVAGWVLDGAAVSSVQLLLDGKPAGTLPVSGARADVCAVYPGYAGCPKVGFSGAVSTAGLSACPHLLRVVAKDADGNQTVLGERALTPKP